jgi:hypothetical protein
MAGYSARQSSYTTGDTITAAHSNDEFNQVLAAFNATTGHTHDGTAGEGGPVTAIRDANTLNRVLVDSTNNHLEFYINVSSSSVQQFRVQDGAIVPITDNDIDLGTSSLEFKDLFIDGTANIDTLAADAISLGGTTITSTGAELNILDGVTSTAAELNILDGVTSTAAELNLLDGITAGTVSASLAVIADSNKDISGFRNLSITGDLTVAGDDITMGTNTAGNLLIADGTNFNSVAVGSLSEISTVASDDVLLAVDTSGGGLKKITRATLTAGIVSGSEISNVVEDTSPQLGGDLDTNSFNIAFDDAHGINDENGNEQIIFQTTSSAVNQFDITNAATGNAPKLSSTGGDSNIDLEIEAKGTGHVTVRGNTNSGAIQFNCESNSHGQILKAQPHSAGVTNEMLLPDGADSTLVSLVATQTLTNKTLTTPVIAEIDSGSSITLDATTDIVLDAGGADITLKDDGTTFGSLTNSSGELLIKSGSTPTTAMTFSGANVTFAGTVTIGSAEISEAELEILDGATVTTAELNILDGVTSTAAELNILDGVTSTAAELNIIDGDTSATSTTLVDADRFVVNDNGTMVQVAASDLTTYINANANFASVGKAIAMAIVFG